MREMQVAAGQQLLESKPASRYTPATAVADIMENSISANADQVGTYYNSNTGDRLTIFDRGRAEEMSGDHKLEFGD
ncbi:hypothetical protein MSEDJ_22040 [Mycolicibacterium sediminis]|uniref:Uncharacterized protein n=2 Tax=Mycolicibacterium sediminis TaxID=1286180 RepID=A0A7I7QNZ5_9MYCO|nr:hypothetical protein MSEDJ_22040 [Mycolicibacterium sediminis]